MASLAAVGRIFFRGRSLLRYRLCPPPLVLHSMVLSLSLSLSSFSTICSSVLGVLFLSLSLSLSLSLCFSCCTYITSFHYATASHRRSGHPAATRRSRARQTCITNHLIVSSPNGQYSHGLRLQKERRRESQRARERERERERGRVISAGIGRYKNAKSGPPIRHLRSRPGSDSEGWGRVLETKRFALQGVMVCYTRRLVQTHTRHPGPPTRRARSGK